MSESLVVGAVSGARVNPGLKKEDAMNAKDGYCGLAAAIALIGGASQAFAAAAGKEEGSGILIAIFLAFGALLIVFQLVPGLMLFYSMVKGLFVSSEKGKSSVTVKN
jgi:membrane-bound ClpP family serine protease